MVRTVRAETVVLWLCVALVAIAGLAPIAAIAVESFRHNGQFSLNYYRELISAARFWPLFGNSIRLALATTAVCGLIGVPVGILFAKSDLPLRSGFMWLLTVPFVLPPYFVALGWARVVARIGVSACDWLFGLAGSSSASHTATERSGDRVFPRARVSPCDGRVERSELSALSGIAGAEFYPIYGLV